MHQVILFYKYVKIKDPEKLKQDQLSLCEELGLKGRIIIAEEGINATLEGTKENIKTYCETLKKDRRFSDIHFKFSEGTGDAFPRLSVKVRDEIVTLKLGKKDLDPTKTTGKHLKPEELKKWYENNEDFEVVDMRNDYEYAVGHFRNSHLLPVKNFREIPQAVKNIKKLKKKKVVAVCTGGIRCEKATGYLKKEGFEDVYQLDGGIVSYMEKYPNQDFEGKLYVFDGRITMGFETNNPQHKVVGNCVKCGAKSDDYADCKNRSCRSHFICCTSCRDEDNTALCPQEH